MGDKPRFVSQRQGKPAEPAVKSPCVSTCVLDDNDECTGCYRTGDEISTWGRLSNTERRQVIEYCLARARKKNPFL